MNNQIRILQAMSSLVHGGVQSVVLNYADKLAEQGILFDYVVQEAGDEQIEADCLAAGSRIYRIPDLMRHPVSGTLELYKLLKQHPEYKIFHAHQNDVNTITLLAAKAAGVKMRISHSHSCRPCTSKVKRLVKGMNHRLLKSVATELWACSKVAYEWLYDVPFEESTHSYILHNAVDVSKFAFCEESRLQYRKELGVDDCFTCVCVATLSANKNQQYLLRVFQKLKERNVSAKLLLIGDGDCAEQLQVMCKQLGVAENVHFLGNRKDVPQLLNAADCMLLPSMFEGLPVSVVEGQVNGLSCVLSTAVPAEVKIREDVYFLDITEQAVTQWTDRIQQLMDNPLPRNMLMQQVAKQGRFDLVTEATCLAGKYKELNEA